MQIIAKERWAAIYCYIMLCYIMFCYVNVKIKIVTKDRKKTFHNDKSQSTRKTKQLKTHMYLKT